MKLFEGAPSPSSPEEESGKQEKTLRMPGEDLTPEERNELSELIRRIRAGESIPAGKVKEARQVLAEQELREVGYTPAEEDGLDRAA